MGNAAPGSDDNIGEKSQKFCSITNDPHYQTIDGRSVCSPGIFVGRCNIN